MVEEGDDQISRFVGWLVGDEEELYNLRQFRLDTVLLPVTLRYYEEPDLRKLLWDNLTVMS